MDFYLYSLELALADLHHLAVNVVNASSEMFPLFSVDLDGSVLEEATGLRASTTERLLDDLRQTNGCNSRTI